MGQSRIGWVLLSFLGLLTLGVSDDLGAAPIPLQIAATPQPDGLSVLYDPTTGNLAAWAPDGVELTALELTSASGSFVGGCTDLTDVFDVCTGSKVFKLDLTGFPSFDFGATLPTGWTAEMLANDLRTNGATLPRGFNVGTGAYVVVVPEPSGLASVVSLLFSCGGLAIWTRGWRGKR